MIKFYSLQHLYPKSQVDVFITILEDDGSSLAAAITCAGLAVADAAIDMFDVIVGSSLVSGSEMSSFDISDH